MCHVLFPWLENHMQPRKYVKYTSRLRRWIVNQCLLGITPISQIARNREVPRRTIYVFLERYKQGGLEALEPKKRGRQKDLVNSSFEQQVIARWHDQPRGVHKLWLDFAMEGYSVSERKIQEVLRCNSLKMNKRSRPTQIKFTKYEWPEPNMLWHVDWTDCPFTGKKLIAFIDDYSRFLVHAEYFEHATTENTLLAFFNAVAKYGNPQAVLSDQGTQFTPARGEKGPFTLWCESQGIKHILGRIHHPQTNGKIERWFGTYKIEYQPQRWTLDEYVHVYNYKRRHQGIGYIMPYQRYTCANNSV
jgi:putative transposase